MLLYRCLGSSANLCVWIWFRNLQWYKSLRVQLGNRPFCLLFCISLNFTTEYGLSYIKGRPSSVFTIWLKRIYIFFQFPPGTVKQLVLMNKNSQQNHGMWLLEGTIYSQESCRLLERRRKEQPQNTWPLKACMNSKYHLCFGHLYCSRQQNMGVIRRHSLYSYC